MSTTQATLDDRETFVRPYQLGDCLTDRSTRTDSEKLILDECPLCRTDPTRPRYFFDEHENRPQHFVAHP